MKKIRILRFIYLMYKTNIYENNIIYFREKYKFKSSMI